MQYFLSSSYLYLWRTTVEVHFQEKATVMVVVARALGRNPQQSLSSGRVEENSRGDASSRRSAYRRCAPITFALITMSKLRCISEAISPRDPTPG